MIDCFNEPIVHTSPSCRVRVRAVVGAGKGGQGGGVIDVHLDALAHDALPALKSLYLYGIPASAVAKVAPVCEARDTLLFASHLEEFGFESGSESDEIEDEEAEGGD